MKKVWMASRSEQRLMNRNRNIWGTIKTYINADEFCIECEREIPFHYNNCPTRNKNEETQIQP